mgnify:CR=1 FL=1
MKVFAKSDIGKAREMNQDAYYISDSSSEVKLYIIADGMGGYKGGEIVPTLFIGATFGCLFGNLIGFSPSLCSAVGITAMFCGVTNSPITSLLLSFELFGYEGMPYYLLATAFSYMFSGYFGLYKSQRIIYSKYRASYVNKTTS